MGETTVRERREKMSQCTCKNRPASSWTSDVGPSWYRHQQGCYYYKPTGKSGPRSSRTNTNVSHSRQRFMRSSVCFWPRSLTPTPSILRNREGNRPSQIGSLWHYRWTHPSIQVIEARSGTSRPQPRGSRWGFFTAIQIWMCFSGAFGPSQVVSENVAKNTVGHDL